MATLYAQAMEQVVRDVAPTLGAAGFRKRRHTFNRRAEAGIVHVVNFQMGPYEPPGTEEIPPFRLNLYGKFTVNLGVFVPEMVIERGRAPKGWVNEYNCQLRKRLGELRSTPADVWWSLDDPTAAGSDMTPDLNERGLTWLDRFATRSDLLREYWSEGWIALGMRPRAPVEIAWLLADSDRNAAESILRDYLLENLNAAHRTWLEATLRANGFGSLVTR